MMSNKNVCQQFIFHFAYFFKQQKINTHVKGFDALRPFRLSIGDARLGLLSGDFTSEFELKISNDKNHNLWMFLDLAQNSAFISYNLQSTVFFFCPRVCFLSPGMRLYLLYQVHEYSKTKIQYQPKTRFCKFLITHCQNLD